MRDNAKGVNTDTVNNKPSVMQGCQSNKRKEITPAKKRYHLYDQLKLSLFVDSQLIVYIKNYINWLLCLLFVSYNKVLCF